MRLAQACCVKSFLLLVPALFLAGAAAQSPGITLRRDGHWLLIERPDLPGGTIRINYLEAYCRPGAHDADWVRHTVIPHTNDLVELAPDRRRLLLRDRLADGVVVEHVITAAADEVDFRLTARNPTQTVSEAHWAQPCVRLGEFTGFGAEFRGGEEDYLPRCFLFLDGRLSRLPLQPWATQARYTPGQVWRGPRVPADDVNPRPLSPLLPSHGLIGCFNADESLIFATAWEPWHELFQGVARCLHSDFRLGGLLPGETKEVRGKIYLVAPDATALLRRYEADFPERVGH